MVLPKVNRDYLPVECHNIDFRECRSLRVVHVVHKFHFLGTKFLSEQNFITKKFRT